MRWRGVVCVGLIAALGLAVCLASADPPIHDYVRCAAPYMIYPLGNNEDPWEQQDERMIGQWASFGDIMTAKANPPGSDSYWGGNRRNEIQGFVDDSEMYRRFGFHWGSAAGVCITWVDHSNCVAESDIAFNPEYDWSTDTWAILEDPDSELAYQHVLLHELGHTIGFADYNYKSSESKGLGYNTIMNYAYPWNYWVLGVDDAMGVDTIFPERVGRQYDFGVYAFHCESKTKCPMATVSPGMVSTGGSISIHDLQVASLGRGKLSNARVTVTLLSYPDHNQSYELESVVWDTFPGYGSQLVDLTVSVPSGVPAGTYYVELVASHSRSAQDPYAKNDSVVLPTHVRVLDEGEQDPTGPGHSACYEMVGVMYQQCGLKLDSGGSEISYNDAVLLCYDNNGPWSCAKTCFDTSIAAGGCGTFESCLTDYCGMPLADEEAEDEEDDGGCGG
ncbi:MAG: hypothetical protein P9L99_15855 [Candidatus Lernaella stagnicola]|nr:hypothetical protein [Candidatus Lernaella stagnicola]